MGTVGDEADGAGGRMRAMSKASVLALAAIGVAAVKIGADLAKLGADILEIESKFDTVTGGSAAMAEEWIDNFGAMAGFTESEGKAMIGNLANVAKGAGFAEQAATQFAVAASQLAGDLGSFNNQPTVIW